MDSFEKRDYLRSGNKSTWRESNKGLDVELDVCFIWASGGASLFVPYGS